MGGSHPVELRASDFTTDSGATGMGGKARFAIEKCEPDLRFLPIRTLFVGARIFRMKEPF
jgi:hypothetical protein